MNSFQNDGKTARSAAEDFVFSAEPHITEAADFLLLARATLEREGRLGTQGITAQGARALLRILGDAEQALDRLEDAYDVAVKTVKADRAPFQAKAA